MYSIETKSEDSRAIQNNSEKHESIAQFKDNRSLSAVEVGQNTAQLEKKENLTGMPDNLKEGIESLSGFSMDDVRVHYNSSKPATVQALAYTQGTDIHVAPGQEKHLPHEAWHVAQQMAGRVSPTTNINGMPVNDNAELEHEADVMGAKALQNKKKNLNTQSLYNQTKNDTLQCITIGQKQYLDKKIKYNGVECSLNLNNLKRCNPQNFLRKILRFIIVDPFYSNPDNIVKDQSIESIVKDIANFCNEKGCLPYGCDEYINSVGLSKEKIKEKKLSGYYSSSFREYAYGAANTVPHIHCYKGGAHIKYLDGVKIKRVNLVKNGIVVINTAGLQSIKEKLPSLDKDRIVGIIQEITGICIH